MGRERDRQDGQRITEKDRDKMERETVRRRETGTERERWRARQRNGERNGERKRSERRGQRDRGD